MFWVTCCDSTTRMWQIINKATARPNGPEVKGELPLEYVGNRDRCQQNVSKSPVLLMNFSFKMRTNPGKRHRFLTNLSVYDREIDRIPCLTKSIRS